VLGLSKAASNELREDIHENMRVGPSLLRETIPRSPISIISLNSQQRFQNIMRIILFLDAEFLILVKNEPL